MKSLFLLCLKFSLSEILALILQKFITRYQHDSALEKITLFYFVQKSFSIYHIEFIKNVKNFISQFYYTYISGKNYLSWILDAEINLEVANLGETIKEENQRSLQDHTKALIFLRHHLHEDLKIEYLTVKDPLIL